MGLTGKVQLKGKYLSTATSPKGGVLPELSENAEAV